MIFQILTAAPNVEWRQSSSPVCGYVSGWDPHLFTYLPVFSSGKVRDPRPTRVRVTPLPHECVRGHVDRGKPQTNTKGPDCDPVPFRFCVA